MSCLQNVVFTVQYTPHTLADLEKLPSRVCRASQQDSKSLSSVRCLNNLAGWKMQWKLGSVYCARVSVIQWAPQDLSCLLSADYHQHLCHSSYNLIKLWIEMCLSCVKGSLHSWRKYPKGDLAAPVIGGSFFLYLHCLLFCAEEAAGKKKEEVEH